MARTAVKRGLRLSVGSWNTIWMRLRNGSLANFLAGMAPMSWPSNMMRPSDLSIRRMTMVEVVDLPQPDSPTSPTLSPRCTVKLMPSTARKVAGCSGAGAAAPLRRNILAKPPLKSFRAYSLTSFSTTSSGARLSPLGCAAPLSLAAGGGAGAAAAGGSAPVVSPSGSRSRKETPGRGVARISFLV